MEKLTDIKNILKKYLNEVYLLKSGESRKESYYPHLEIFLNEVTEFYGRKDIVIYSPSGNMQCGSPDFRVLAPNSIIGYIETKKPGTDLIKFEKTDQIKGYLEVHNNLIVTDFYNFRLYRDKTLIKEVSLKNVEQNECFVNLFGLLRVFFKYSTPKIYDELAAKAKELSESLAIKTKELKTHIEKDAAISPLDKVFDLITYMENEFPEGCTGIRCKDCPLYQKLGANSHMCSTLRWMIKKDPHK